MQQLSSQRLDEHEFHQADGLTTQEASLRRASIGANELAPAQRAATFRQILLLLANPLVIILLLAGIVSALLGQLVNAAIIIVMVLLSVAINFLQTFRSQRAAERLRETVAPTATTLRDGGWVELPRRELVPGDIIRLVAGDLVPADALLLNARDLHVQQATLTGESMPVEKEACTGALTSVETPDTRNMVYLGTSVVSGIATARVMATGRATAFGGIAARLASRAPETEFERGTRRFGLLIMRAVVFLVLFVFLVNVAFKRDPFESLLFAVALAVGLTPEFLPMITTVTLGQGAVHMSRQKVIVKHLAAIQNFGSMDILYGVVCRITRHPNACTFRDPHCQQPAQEPPESSSNHNDACHRDCGSTAAAHAAGGATRIYTPAARVSRLPRRDDSPVSTPRRVGQAPTDAEASALKYSWAVPCTLWLPAARWRTRPCCERVIAP